ncbi:NAD-dependent epimerase/dehydratase family protein [Roseiconus lacunae]|uniref:NAD-dependent epimerase/dehydratase family protein n=1 Tax=Roseiconus lacunae TaxID=2605694 RepID=UPI0033146DF8
MNPADTPKRVCVLGASGRLGSAIVKHLSCSGFQVRAASRNPSAAARSIRSGDRVQWVALDVGSLDQLREVIRGCDATVFAIGAKIPCYASDSLSVAEFQRVNVELLSRAAQASLLEGNGPFVHLGSLFSLGIIQDGWISSKTKPNPKSPFEISEHDGECKILHRITNDGLNARILRLPPIVDGGRPGGLLSMLAIAWQSRKYEAMFLEHRNTWKPMMYLADALKSVEAALDSKSPHFICSVSSGAKTLEDFLNFSTTPESKDTSCRPSDTSFRHFLRRYLPSNSRVDLRQANDKLRLNLASIARGDCSPDSIASPRKQTS